MDVCPFQQFGMACTFGVPLPVSLYLLFLLLTVEACLVQSSLTSHSGWVVSVNWSPKNPHHLLSGSYDSTLRLWDTRSTKKPLFSIAAHKGKVMCSDWSDSHVRKPRFCIAIHYSQLQGGCNFLVQAVCMATHTFEVVVLCLVLEMGACNVLCAEKLTF
jgi:hypothetical protein